MGDRNIESAAEFNDVETEYLAWRADHGHNVSDNGASRHLFWAGWLAGRDWQRRRDGQDNTGRYWAALHDAGCTLSAFLRLFPEDSEFAAELRKALMSIRTALGPRIGAPAATTTTPDPED